MQKFLTTNKTNVLTQIYQEDMPFTSTWAVDAYIVGMTASGDVMRRTLSGLFQRTAGGASTLVAAVAVGAASVTTDAGLTGDLTSTGNGIQVRVTDGGLAVTNWNAITVIQEVFL